MENYEMYRKTDHCGMLYDEYIVVLYNECDLLSVEKDLIDDEYIILKVVNGKIIFCKKVTE